MTTGGQEHTVRIDYPKGDPENPLSWSELTDKFRNLVSPVFSKDRQNKIIEKITSIEKEENMVAFSELLVRA